MVTTSRISRWIFSVTNRFVIKCRFPQISVKWSVGLLRPRFSDNNLPYSSFEPWYPNFFRVKSKLTRCYLFDIPYLDKWKWMILVTQRRSFLWLLWMESIFLAKRQTFALSRQYIFQKLYLKGFIHSEIFCTILVHPMRRANFAGKLQLRSCNSWDCVVTQVKSVINKCFQL